MVNIELNTQFNILQTATNNTTTTTFLCIKRIFSKRSAKSFAFIYEELPFPLFTARSPAMCATTTRNLISKSSVGIMFTQKRLRNSLTLTIHSSLFCGALKIHAEAIPNVPVQHVTSRRFFPHLLSGRWHGFGCARHNYLRLIGSGPTDYSEHVFPVV